jgi:hypothetical protein
VCSTYCGTFRPADIVCDVPYGGELEITVVQRSALRFAALNRGLNLEKSCQKNTIGCGGFYDRCSFKHGQRQFASQNRPSSINDDQTNGLGKEVLTTMHLSFYSLLAHTCGEIR